METSGHTQYEHAEYEHAESEAAESEAAEDEHAEDEHAEDEPSEDEHTQYDPSEDEHTEYDPSEYEHTEYEPTEYEHTEYHINELRISGPSALIKNQVLGQRLRFVQLGAKSGEAWGLASAAVRQKLSNAGSTIGYGAYSVAHPLHPARRRAAKDAHKQQKKLASGINPPPISSFSTVACSQCDTYNRSMKWICDI